MSMESIFGRPTPQVIAPPPVPQVDDAVTQRLKDDSAALKRGRATTIFTSDAGLPDLGKVTKPQATAGA